MSIQNILKDVDRFRGRLLKHSNTMEPGVDNDLVHVNTSLQNQVTAYQQNSTFLKQRMRNTAEIIAEVVQLKSQLRAEEQSLSIWAITVATLCYLPCSFVAVS
jgi:hypothetical protein